MWKNLLSVPAFAGVLLVSARVSLAATLVENFTADPLSQGWLVAGNTNLFRWSAANQNLEVTWDSAQSNSYFCRPLATNVTRSSDFMLGFDLRLSDVGPGTDTNKPFTFQIAIGLLNLAQATGTNFIRGSGTDSPNLVEFDYFWDSGFGATVSPALISGNNEFNDGGFTFPLELTTNALFRVTMTYTAADRRLRTRMTRDGVPFGPIKDATLGTSFSDFTVDHVSVSSYSDVGQFPGFEGSVLAHGTVDNVIFAAPTPVTTVSTGAGGAGTVAFQSATNWLYTLERTTNFQAWAAASAAVPGSGSTLVLQDTNAPAGSAYYRVRAELP